ncbi:hypothetical protein WJX75_007835 [Coccomyxa subellipsoidea]|uniref:Nucleosome assembly protein n=1 Tax=Coccomyxa subellipsoidea TaxID=248742 RepID=A0ABR2Z528_9CHLO
MSHPVEAEEVFDANPAGHMLGAEGNAALVEVIQARLNTMIGKSSGFVETLPKQVQARIQALRDLQDTHDEHETEYQKELKALQAKYDALYAPLYEERNAIVNGEKDVPAPKEEEGEPKEEEGPVPAGIPEFWLGVLRANRMIGDSLTEKDEEVLKHLTDISVSELAPEPDEDGDEIGGFKLIFHFSANPFFSHTELEKTYYIYEEDGEPMLHRAEGTKIDWAAGKNPTVKVMRKKAKPGKGGRGAAPKMLTKIEPVPSFFNFFSPPQEPEEDEDIDEEDLEELRNALEEDFEMGETIRTRIIPHAVKWYTGEANEEDEDDDEDDDEGDDIDEDDDEEGEEDDDEDAIDEKDIKQALKGGEGDKGEKPPECKQQ